MNRWAVEGTALLAKSLDGLSDAELDRPTTLPGWSRRHLLAHLASNAEALSRLVSWARTGVETPMYASPAQRAADIETGSRESPARLREWFHGSAEELATGLAGLSEQAWSAEVRTAQGRTVPATEVPWMRAREVCIHAVDLDAGLRFADLPAGFLTALVDDISGWRANRGDGPALSLTDGGRDWTVAGTGEPTRVELALPELAGWLAGRAPHPELPPLPRWL